MAFSTACLAASRRLVARWRAWADWRTASCTCACTPGAMAGIGSASKSDSEMAGYMVALVWRPIRSQTNGNRR